jgi:hypothetical protein
MKKTVEFIVWTALITLSGSAFAQPDVKNNRVLEDILAHTDAQLALSLGQAMAAQDFTVPAPADFGGEAAAPAIELTDITDKCTRDDEVVSAYPKVYKLFRSAENFRIIKVFNFTDPDGKGRRIEVYFTGEDWMRYGLIYFVTNAGRDKDTAGAYFISALSTPDLENGGTAPVVNPSDTNKLGEFIVTGFLEADGNVKAGFNSVASAPVLP